MNSKGNYGTLGALIGVAGSIWFWFGMNIAEFKFRHISLYEAFTDTSIQAANGFSFSGGHEVFWTVFTISTLVVSAVFGVIGSLAKR